MMSEYDVVVDERLSSLEDLEDLREEVYDGGQRRVSWLQWCQQRKRGVLLAGLLTLGLVMVVAIVVAIIMPFVHPSSSYPYFVQVKNMMTHLQAFQSIAAKHNNSRSPFYGYNDTIRYVHDLLAQNTDLELSIQPFSFSYSIEPEPPSFWLNTAEGTSSLVYGVDWMSAMNQGSGNVTARLSFVPNQGCNASDWTASFVQGTIAVMDRGGCLFTDKAKNARAMNATGVLVVNTQGMDLPSGVSIATQIGFPYFIVGNDVGFFLGLLTRADPAFTVTMYSSSVPVMVYTSNLIADTPAGNKAQTIVVGSHLDSVTAGPGINDNGSGAAANLEMALNIHRVSLANRVRFAWWGAEELGLLGSEAYVASLTSDELKEIALNLNFDMIASPNFFRGVYDGRSADPAYPLLLNGSTVIQQLFEEYFQNNNLTCHTATFDGRSDYGPFLEKKIPAGGLFTGAEVIKEDSMVAAYGGVANTPYDPCYHLSCDTILNINPEVYADMSKAAATVLEILATQSDLNAYFAEKVTPEKGHVRCLQA